MLFYFTGNLFFFITLLCSFNNILVTINLHIEKKYYFNESCNGLSGIVKIPQKVHVISQMKNMPMQNKILIFSSNIDVSINYLEIKERFPVENGGETRNYILSEFTLKDNFTFF